MRLRSRVTIACLASCAACFALLAAPVPDPPERTKARLVSSIKTPAGRWGLLFSPDGRRLVTTGADCSARVIDVRSGECLVKITGHASAPDGAFGKDGVMRALALSRDGKVLATASEDAIRLWDTTTGNALGVLGEKNPQRAVRSLAFSADGKTLISGGHDVRTWDVARCEQKSCFKSASNTTIVAFADKDSPRAAAVEWVTSKNRFHDVIVYDGALGKQRPARLEHDKTVMRLALSPDATRVITASWDHKARVWDAASGKLLCCCTVPGRSARSIAISPDSSTVAVTWIALDEKGAFVHPARPILKIHDAATGKERATIPAPEEEIGYMAFGPKSDTLAISITYKPLIQVWELPTK